jgi:hypothetical protein
LSIREVLEADLDGKADSKDIRALFAFDSTLTEEEVVLRFRLWSRHFFFRFFHTGDAPFHREMDRRDLAVYRGTEPVFINAGFRGCAKTTRTKLFLAFCIANDVEHRHRYIKTLSEDYANARQNVTDLYNLLISPRIKHHYPEIFEKTDSKREETMASFTTATGVKVRADSVGMGQRGDIQEDSRPSLLWFEDFENRKVLRSAVTLQSIWDNMEEARTGMATHGGALYNCNYLSERGNVHKLIEKHPDCTLITPIRKDGTPTWPEAYTPETIKRIEKAAEDFAGEYLQEPSIGADIFFDRTSLDRQQKLAPRRTVAGFKLFHEFDPSHRYGSGHDIAGGVGLDSSTSVFIDFSCMPNRVAATYRNNLIKPDVFADEIVRQAEMYGECIVAPESNNFGAATITRLKQTYENIFVMEQFSGTQVLERKDRTYGWQTNTATKPHMLMDLRKAVEDGMLELSDPDLIAELRAYTRDDLMDRDEDVRLTTRHFDLLIACAIAWQMRNFATRSYRRGVVHSESTQGQQSKDFDVYA